LAIKPVIDVNKYNRILFQFGSGPCCPGHIDRCLDIVKGMNLSGKLLDIGCGTGHWTEMFGKNGFVAHGIDIELLPALKERTHSSYFEGDMHAIPFENGFFDVCFSNGVFEHSIAPFVACCEMNRVLKTGGYAIIVVPTERNVRLIYMEQHVSIFTLDGYKNLFQKAGFMITHFEMNYGNTNDEHYIFTLQKTKEVTECRPDMR
jgi:ubiquinone/menaquinone biosynthesis C-methylase UbiE